MYIDDFCKIIKWFIDNKPKYHTYNVTTGDKIDLFSIANLINNVVEKQCLFTYVKMAWQMNIQQVIKGY